jgi:hypothetical protein
MGPQRRSATATAACGEGGFAHPPCTRRSARKLRLSGKPQGANIVDEVNMARPKHPARGRKIRWRAGCLMLTRQAHGQPSAAQTTRQDTLLLLDSRFESRGSPAIAAGDHPRQRQVPVGISASPSRERSILLNSSGGSENAVARRADAVQGAIRRRDDGLSTMEGYYQRYNDEPASESPADRPNPDGRRGEARNFPLRARPLSIARPLWSQSAW